MATLYIPGASGAVPVAVMEKKQGPQDAVAPEIVGPAGTTRVSVRLVIDTEVAPLQVTVPANVSVPPDWVRPTDADPTEFAHAWVVR
jgi:hypothetical protein